MIGKELNHYKILEPLGRGGMGEVYLAEDAKLHRKIALKVLPAELASDPESLARFQREARAIAALNHPNIITIHSVEEDEGVHFITMELVEGSPLTDRVSEAGMSADDLRAVAIPITEAVAAAHAKGITHRDLKTDNVMVGHDGRIKVLDFGLARFTAPSLDAGEDSSAPTEARTREGVIVGTVPYMSPEQVEGRGADERSDVFSLGVMLYELATGRRPFRGDSPIATLSSILKDEPAPIGEIRPGFPERFERVIARCLEKRPDDRYPSAEELFRELSRFESSSPEPASEPAEAPWVAVRAFQTKASELESFADGLTEDVATGLARFSHLYVVSASSPTRHDERFAVEGSIRKSGSAVRVSVRLLDAESGQHLWAENFDRDLADGDVFAAQDALTDRIVATVADVYGVLSRSLAALVKDKPVDTLTAYECILRMFWFLQQITPAAHADARTALERLLEREPGHAEAWGCLAWLYVQEYKLGFNPRPHALDRALSAARRALELDGSCQMGYSALAHTHYCRRELAAFRPAAERALAINPRATFHVAFIAFLLATAGDWEKGTAVMREAMALNPHVGGWCHIVFVFDHYRSRDYEKAVEAAELVNQPGFHKAPAILAAANAQLGRMDAAKRDLKDLLELAPDYATWARDDWTKEFVSEELAEHMLEGLRKAGLALEEPKPGGDSKTVPWVAVRAFKASSGDADLESFADGLTGDITVGLSRFSHLNVVSADASSRPRERFAVEGAVRKADSSIRVSVKLLDAETGNHLWAENFDRDLSESDVLAAQDELTDRIVATVADTDGVLTRSLAALFQTKPIEELSAYEAVILGLNSQQRLSAEEHAKIRDALELAVEREPNHADAWAALSLGYDIEHKFGYNTRPDALERALKAAQRSIELDAANATAHVALAHTHFTRRELPACRAAGERALALNPRDAWAVAVVGWLTACSGDWEEGTALIRRAMALNPHHAGWLHMALAVDYYRQGQYAEALEEAEKKAMPGFYKCECILAASNAELGRTEAAKRHLENLVALVPDYAARAREDLSREFVDDALVEHYLEGLRKAGLEIDGGEPAPSIAVLPFANMSADPDSEYFGDGLAEEIINALTKLETMRVVARTSAFSFKGQSVDVREIGEKLDVGAVLEGSVRRAGNRLRVTAQLVSVADGYHLWSERYDRELEDVFAIQDEITSAIVKALEVELVGGEKERVRARSTANQEAFASYLEGRFHFHRLVTPELEKAIEHYRQAIALDPDYAQPYAGLAAAYAFVGGAGPIHSMPHEQAYPEVRTAVEKALALDPELPEAHAMLGVMRTVFEWDWTGAEQAFQKALELGPQNADSHLWYGFHSWMRCRFDAARTEFEGALALDPLSPLLESSIALTLYNARRYEDAIAGFERVLDRYPNWFHSQMHLGDALVEVGELERAESYFLRSRAHDPGHSDYLTARLCAVRAALGRGAEAEAMREELIADSKIRLVLPTYIAMAHLALGDMDATFRSLEEETSIELAIWVMFPWSDPARSDPRFEAVRERLGMDPHA